MGLNLAKFFFLLAFHCHFCDCMKVSMSNPNLHWACSNDPKAFNDILYAHLVKLRYISTSKHTFWNVDGFSCIVIYLELNPIPSRLNNILFNYWGQTQVKIKEDNLSSVFWKLSQEPTMLACEHERVSFVSFYMYTSRYTTTFWRRL